MKIIIFYFSILLLASCGGGKHMPLEKTTPPPTSGSAKTQEGDVTESGAMGPTYNEDILPIFNKNCSACHKAGSGLPNWSNYSEAYAKRGEIMERDVIKKTMPPPGLPPLQKSEIQLIKGWIEGGGRESKSAQAVVSTQATEVSVEDIGADGFLKSGLYCEKIEKYPSGDIKSNEILSGKFYNNEMKTVSGVKIIFDSFGKAVSVDTPNYLRSKTSFLEVCGVEVSDANHCKINTQITDPSHALVKVSCHQESLSMDLMVDGDGTEVICKTKDSKVSVKYTGCQLNL